MIDYLTNRIIKEIKIASDCMALLFVFDDGQLIARTDADCCSYTWIEHVELPTELPAKIVSHGSIELNSGADNQGGELAFYGYKIVTDKGDIVIDYRNESNGYYGGSISFGEDEYFYGGVYGQNVSKQQWEDLK